MCNNFHNNDKVKYKPKVTIPLLNLNILSINISFTSAQNDLCHQDIQKCIRTFGVFCTSMY